jgi:hypothetical protein
MRELPTVYIKNFRSDLYVIVKTDITKGGHMLSENEKITGTFINEIVINKYIDKTIKAWSTSKKANIDNLVDNYGYYYEGGEDEEYTSLDYLHETFANRVEVLSLFMKELNGVQDRIHHFLEMMQDTQKTISS